MTSVSEQGCVEFRFFRRDVGGVRVVGDFGTPFEAGFEMTGDPDGWWRATAALGAGEYRFRYVADGVWFADYASNGIEVSKTGVQSVLVVPEVNRQAAQPDSARMVA